MFETEEARHFKFGVQTDRVEYDHTHDRIPLKDGINRHVTYLDFGKYIMSRKRYKMET